MAEMQDNLVDRTLWCRHEMKYQISESMAAAISHYITAYMRPDRYSELQEEGAYPIVSLYLDSPDLRLCRESLTGEKNRFKLRIRSYTDNLEYPRFFEIKRRVNTIIIKSRARILSSSVAPLITGEQRPPSGNRTEDEALNQFMLYKGLIHAGPVVKVRYMRQAYEGIMDDRVRITFDRQLCCCVTHDPEVEMNGPGYVRLPVKDVVLEIKFTGPFPPWVARMCKFFGLKSRSFSKYANSVRQACLLRYCAPLVSPQSYLTGGSK
jgi:hypothetical protein